MECTKLVWMLNLWLWITWFHSAKSTVYNQYHRSRRWFIRSAVAYDEGWRKGGSQQMGGQVTGQTEWKQGCDMTLQFCRWAMPEQKSGIWRKEVNSWLISRSDKQLALPHGLRDWEHQIAAFCHTQLCTLVSSHAQISLCLNKSILSHT